MFGRDVRELFLVREGLIRFGGTVLLQR